MKKLILLTIILLCKISTYSQLFDNAIYVKGEIITISDTIECYVPLQNYYDGTIKYKLIKEDKKALKIEERQIVSLSNNTQQFDRIFIKERPELMECLCKGKISLYKDVVCRSGGSSPMVNADLGSGLSAGISVNIPYEKDVLYLIKDYYVFKVKKSKVKDIITELMADDKELEESVNSFDKKDIIWDFKLKQLVNRYNRNARYNDIQ